MVNKVNVQLHPHTHRAARVVRIKWTNNPIFIETVTFFRGANNLFGPRLKNSLLIFALFTIVMTIANCNKSNPIATNASGELIPLKVGNMWVWQISNYDNTGKVIGTAIDSSWVSQDTIVNGAKYFQVWEQYKHLDGTVDQVQNYYLSRNSTSGFSRMDGNQEHVLYNYPFQNGDPTIISSSVLVAVPAGTYDCIEYQTAEGSYVIDGQVKTLYGKSYISSSVGLVKHELLLTRQELIRFSLVN
jgi:hypothetical protein